MNAYHLVIAVQDALILALGLSREEANEFVDQVSEELSQTTPVTTLMLSHIVAARSSSPRHTDDSAKPICPRYPRDLGFRIHAVSICESARHVREDYHVGTAAPIASPRPFSDGVHTFRLSGKW